MKLKRIGAVLIDLIIIGFICGLIQGLPLFETDRKASYEYTNYVMDSVLNGGSTELDEKALNDKTYEYQKDSIRASILQLGITVLYFGVLGFIWKGQTLGKKLFKLRTVNDDGNELNSGLFFLREIIKTNALFDLITLIILTLCSKNTFLAISPYISYLTDAIIIILVGTMIFREDEKGLHDIICRTKVISTQEK